MYFSVIASLIIAQRVCMEVGMNLLHSEWFCTDSDVCTKDSFFPLLRKMGVFCSITSKVDTRVRYVPTWQ